MRKKQGGPCKRWTLITLVDTRAHGTPSTISVIFHRNRYAAKRVVDNVFVSRIGAVRARSVRVHGHRWPIYAPLGRLLSMDARCAALTRTYVRTYFPTAFLRYLKKKTRSQFSACSSSAASILPYRSAVVITSMLRVRTGRNENFSSIYKHAYTLWRYEPTRSTYECR